MIDIYKNRTLIYIGFMLYLMYILISDEIYNNINIKNKYDIILLLLISYISINLFINDISKLFINNTSKITKWNRNKCEYKMSNTLNRILDDNNIQQGENCDLYIPCGYDNMKDEIKKMPIKKDMKYFIINNADYMTAKDWLWKNVVNYHGITKASTLMPLTYILSNDRDMNIMKNDFRNDKIYIMKKNIQRQEGLKITNNINEIIKGRDEGYVLVQELLQNPYIINERKTNMRFYVLIICKNNKINVFVYNDGFMYYTREIFIKGSLEVGPNITTGYIDRQIYETNPLTHKDLCKYLDKERILNKTEIEKRGQGNILSEIYFIKINELLKEIFISFIGKICNGKLKNNMTFQLFGVDIAVDENLNPMIMEINKGPDMEGKDKRDTELKYNVMSDVMKLIGLIKNDEKNGFYEIINSVKN